MSTTPSKSVLFACNTILSDNAYALSLMNYLTSKGCRVNLVVNDNFGTPADAISAPGTPGSLPATGSGLPSSTGEHLLATNNALMTLPNLGSILQSTTNLCMWRLINVDLTKFGTIKNHNMISCFALKNRDQLTVEKLYRAQNCTAFICLYKNGEDSWNFKEKLNISSIYVLSMAYDYIPIKTKDSLQHFHVHIATGLNSQKQFGPRISRQTTTTYHIPRVLVAKRGAVKRQIGVEAGNQPLAH